MSEKIRYAPKKIPGLFAAFVVLFVLAAAYGCYLVAPTVTSFLDKDSGSANAAAAAQAKRQVDISDLKVGRTKISAKTAASAKAQTDAFIAQYGAVTEGATTAARESVHVVWSSAVQCVAGDVPTYKVQVSHAQLSSDEDVADYATRTFTTTDKSIYVTHIQNGLTYDIEVSGTCSTDVKYGTAVKTQFTQQLPISSGVTVSSHGGKYSLFFGHVSTSPDVRYEFQYLKSGGEWTLFKDAAGDIGYTTGPTGFSLGYGTVFRVRAYTLDKSEVGDWSKAGTVKQSENYSSGYSSYYYGN